MMTAKAMWREAGGGFTDEAGGIWRSCLIKNTIPVASQSALFLDRDGVVVEEVNYLSRPQDVRLIQDAGIAIAQAQSRGYAVILVTNQSGIARAYFDWAAFEAVQIEISRQLAAYGASIDGVYACGYHSTGKDALSITAHDWRKPAPGMVLAGLGDFSIDPRRSFIVGDRASDIAAGKAAGLAGGFLVQTGYGATGDESASAQRLAEETYSVREVANLNAAWQAIRSLADGVRS